MLSASALDGLLALLSSTNGTFGQIDDGLRQTFKATPTDASTSDGGSSPSGESSASSAASCSPFLARLGAARLLDGGDGAEQATLRPHQRLAALYILARGADDSASAVDASAPASVLSSPFLDTLLADLDRTESILASHAQSPASQVGPVLLERRFILELLLPQLRANLHQPPLHQHSPRSWYEEASQMDDTARQSAIANTPLAAALAPIRQMALANQPPAALLQLLQVDVPLPSAAHTAAILGAATFDTLQPLFAPSATSSSGLTLPFTVPLPRLPAPALFDSADLAAAAAGDAASSSSRLALASGEAEWMRWDPPEDLVWDVQGAWNGAPLSPSGSTGALSPANAGSLGALVSKAMKSQLLVGERHQLLADLKACASDPLRGQSDSILATWLAMVPPARLPALVERNHDVAREFMRQFIAGSARATSSGAPLAYTLNAYLAPLVSMEMSLHSMELVKDLALIDQVSLPADFLHLYIDKCIHSCERLTDKFLQNRHVRLICVFLQSLIRHKIIQWPGQPTPAAAAASSHTSAASSPAAAGSASASSSVVVGPLLPPPGHDVRDVLLVEVQSFLVEFSRIKEAAALFKVIKQLEATAS